MRCAGRHRPSALLSFSCCCRAGDTTARRVRPRLWGAGCLAGLLQGVSRSSGPALLLYWLGGPLPIARFRANIHHILRRTYRDYRRVLYVERACDAAPVLTLRDAALPYVVGFYAGRKFFGAASELTFRRICCALIAAAAVIGFPSISETRQDLPRRAWRVA
jgi:uncharacterized protein